MNTKLNQVQDWADLARRTKWSVTTLAKQCGVSARTLRRYFIAQKGRSPKAWLGEQRHMLALDLLRNGSSVKEVALQLGYQHSETFSREFKNRCGQCPIKACVPSIKFI